MPTSETVRSFTSVRKWAFLGILAAGCGDPSSSRLEPGAKVVVVDPASKYIVLGDSDRRSEPFPSLPQGSDAVVVSDSDEGHDTRRVRVAIKGGQFDGISGTVERKVLKPR